MSPPLSVAPPAPHREAVLPKLHLDEDYPCSLVGNWNTWYGEQDQAGELPTPTTGGCPPRPLHSGAQRGLQRSPQGLPPLLTAP